MIRQNLVGRYIIRVLLGEEYLTAVGKVLRLNNRYISPKTQADVWEEFLLPPLGTKMRGRCTVQALHRFRAPRRDLWKLLTGTIDVRARSPEAQPNIKRTPVACES